MSDQPTEVSDAEADEMIESVSGKHLLDAEPTEPTVIIEGETEETAE